LLRQVLSPARLRPLVEVKLSEALGQPVVVGDIGLRLLPVPALQAGGIRVGRGSGEAPSVALASLRIVPSLTDALRGKLVVDRIDLDGLDVALRRTPQGEWRLPYDPPKAAGSAGPPTDAPGQTLEIRAVRLRDGAFRLFDEAPPGGGPPREVAALRDIKGAFSAGAGGVRVESLTARFRKTELAGSATLAPGRTILELTSPSINSEDLPQIFGFLGAAPIPGLSVAGAAPFSLRMEIPQKGSLSASGQLEAATLRLGTLEVTSLKAPFTVADNVASLTPLTFTAYGGRQTGSVSLALGRDPMGYTVKTDLDGLDVNRAVSANTAAKEVLQGTGRIRGAVKGAGFDAGALKSRLRGEVEVALRNGAIMGLPLLAGINKALRITEGDARDTRFESLDGTFTLASGLAHTEDLRLKAGELSLAAKGDLRFDLTLAFRGSARFSQAKSAGILGRVKEFKYLANDRGELEIPLTIGGTVSAPAVQVDLGSAAGRAVKQELRQRLGDELKKRLGM